MQLLFLLIIQIKSDNLSLSGKAIDSKRIGEELNGPSLIVLSRYNQRAVLHGSAFYIKKAYLLLAPSGAGKSTLATAMTKFHDDISILTDDVIFIEKSGSAMFSGICKVNLNDDSLRGLKILHQMQNRIEICKGINSIKTTCNFYLSGEKRIRNRIPLGGIIFVEKPATKNMIQIQKLDVWQSFYKMVRNIKMKRIMTSY